MKGDFTRSTFRPRKHYSSVRMQQGRVQLDADWNEQADIAAHRVESETDDVVGRLGAPFEDPGFGIAGGPLPSIGKGRLYLDGILVENDRDVLITEQNEFLRGYAPSRDPGHYLAYLDVWQRHVTALEDELIREVALGGPDSATRTQTVWQVRLLGPLAPPLTCSSDPAEWQQIVNAVPSRLKARTATGTAPATLCEVPAGAGYRRLENQLYRVEVHTGGTHEDGKATFKWSRDNGSIVTSWTGQNGRDLIVANIGRDEVLGFAAGQTVELTDDERELRGEAGVLVKLSKAEGQVLTLDPSVPLPQVDRSSFGRNPKVRRWDSNGEIRIVESWYPLEDGVEVLFESDADYRAGDYWMIPARTAKGTVEWPADEASPNDPAAVVRQGIEHHYCRLAILSCDGTSFALVHDCRPKFPPLTALTSLSYVGGDGQEAMPGRELPQWLEVRVACGGWVLEGATVHFAAENSGRLAKNHGGTHASISSEIDVDTGPDGIARCVWMPRPDIANASQQVTAQLIDADGNLVEDEHGNRVQTIHFSANLSIAAEVAYESRKCLLNASTVKDALDQLCKNITLYYVGGDGQEAKCGEWLPQPLQVRVANGDLAIKGARVELMVVEGDGMLVECERCDAHEIPAVVAKPSITATTNATGIASCCWKLGDKAINHRVQAKLEGTSSPLVFFNAVWSRAEGVTYTTDECALLKKARTVQEALDLLCTAKTARHCCFSVGQDGDFQSLQKAIEEAPGRTPGEIHLCLLPPNPLYPHVLKSVLPKNLAHFEILGCGRSVAIDGALILQGAAVVKLRDINFTVPNLSPSEGFVAFVECQRIVMENCSLSAGNDAGSLLRFKGAQSVTLRDCSFLLPDGFQTFLHGTLFEPYALESTGLTPESREQIAKAYSSLSSDRKRKLADELIRRVESGEVAVIEKQASNYHGLLAALKIAKPDPSTLDRLLDAIRATAAGTAVAAIVFEDIPRDVVMDENSIAGDIVIYGNPGLTISAADLRGYIQKFKEYWPKYVQLIPNGRTFRLQGNRLDRVRYGKHMIDRISKKYEEMQEWDDLVDEFFCSNNVFVKPNNQFFAISLGFDSNRSSTKGEAIPWATLLAELATFTGNRSMKPNSINCCSGEPYGDAGNNVRVNLVQI